MSLKNTSILVIDDDPDVLIAVRLLLKTEVKKVVTEKNPENLPALLRENNFDLVLLDMNFKSSINTGNEGIYWLKRIKELNNTVSVIMITAYGDIDLAVRSLKEGASDFILKPWHNEKLLTNIADIIKKTKRTEGGAANREGVENLIGTELLAESEAMKIFFSRLKR
jgi:DNA-binding NtrC family response regulator